jgi:hypothetical protein
MNNNTDNEMNITGGIHLSMHGAYRIQTIDSYTKKVVKDYGWHKNLILNSGMNIIAYTSTANCTLYGCIGTGSRPNYITSSTSQITQSGTYVYLTNTSGLPSFTSSFSSYGSAVVGGDVIIDQDNSQSNVLSVISSSILLVDTNLNYDVGVQKTFTIWKTSQTALEYEVYRSNTYFVGSSSIVGWNCGYQISASTVVNRRTYDFAVESVTSSYSEVGVSWTGVGNGGLFSRTLLPATATLSPNQQLRMTYDLSVTYGPIYAVYKTASIGGWPVSPSTTTIGSESIQSLIGSCVDTNGNTQAMNQRGAQSLEPYAWNSDEFGLISYQFCIWASTSGDPLVTGSAVYVGGAPSRGGDWVQGNSMIYVPATGSWAMYKTGTLTIYQAASTAIRSIGFGAAININQYWYVFPNDPAGQAMAFVFDQPQTKTNLQTLTLGWKWTWGRIIQ